MSYQMLPVTAEGEILLVATTYSDGRARWGEGLDTLADEARGLPLRLAEDPGWDSLQGGDFPGLVPAGGSAPVVVLADIPAVYGGSGVLLVDLRGIPGRGVRVGLERLGRVLAGLLDGSVGFDDLVGGMDGWGEFEGDCLPPAIAQPTAAVRTSFPPLPGFEATLVIRTDFTDEEGWHAVLAEFGDLDEENRTRPTIGDYPDDPIEIYARVIDDPAYASLLPAQVPALIPPKEHGDMALLVDAATMADPTHPLLAVDLFDSPGFAIRIPAGEAGTMAANLEISNMDFAEFG